MLAARDETALAGKYTVLRSLAMGGMAEILLARAHAVTPERLVVLKRMHRQLAVDDDYVQMFVDEARIATTLHHANVVEVYEFGEDHGQYFMTMEYLHGHDLRHVLTTMANQRIPLPLGTAIAIAHDISRGLEYTHTRTDADGVQLGIVHRDVSPHNVVITLDGALKLVDFGIAKARTQRSRTRTGVVKGKTAYMSPEQVMGEPLDPRSDVFCLGILLWEMTTGRRLYRHKSDLKTLQAVVEQDAPLPSTVIPGYPADLERIVVKTLARDPAQRWASAAELGDALVELARRRRVEMTPATLASLMAETFPAEVAAWERARRAGQSLGEHLLAQLDRGNGTALPRAVTMTGDDEPGPDELEDLPTTIMAMGARPAADRAAGSPPAAPTPVAPTHVAPTHVAPTTPAPPVVLAPPHRAWRPQRWQLAAAIALAALLILLAMIGLARGAAPTAAPPVAALPASPGA